MAVLESAPNHCRSSSDSQKMVTIATLTILLTSAGMGDGLSFFKGGESAGPAEGSHGATKAITIDNPERQPSRVPDRRLISKYPYRQWVKRVQLRHAERERERRMADAAPSQKSPELSKLLVVDKLGYGDFTSVQAAIDFVPRGNRKSILIVVTPGIYEEQVTIPKSKPFITLQGGGRGVTIIIWHAAAHDWAADGTPLGTYKSATFGVSANHFIARDISFQNAAPHADPGVEGMQAVAVRVTGDFATFESCGFYGGQDTLYDHRGRHYFKDCYIEGSIDYVFGYGQSLYVGCTLHSVGQSGSLTAQKRSTTEDRSGFSFVNCTVMGSARDLLGRAWGQFSRVVFSYTYMDDIIIPGGWSDWNDPYRERTVYFGQYKCYGPGSNEQNRVPWSHELTDEEAQPFLDLGFIDGYKWLSKPRQAEYLTLLTALKNSNNQQELRPWIQSEPLPAADKTRPPVF